MVIVIGHLLKVIGHSRCWRCSIAGIDASGFDIADGLGFDDPAARFKQSCSFDGAASNLHIARGCTHKVTPPWLLLSVVGFCNGPTAGTRNGHVAPFRDEPCTLMTQLAQWK
jgi:hypothetical protein